MEPQSAPVDGERLSPRQVFAWTLFVAVLLVALSLFFQYADRIVPMLDVVTDR
jgi:hypothetical protein